MVDVLNEFSVLRPACTDVSSPVTRSGVYKRKYARLQERVLILLCSAHYIFAHTAILPFASQEQKEVATSHVVANLVKFAGVFKPPRTHVVRTYDFC